MFRVHLGMVTGGVMVLLACQLSYGQGDKDRTERSPHGSLNMPCQDCHTLTSWKPLRSTLEFDHNRTAFPLRGLHEGVACTSCHVSMVFTNVGTKCADCHADIHKGQMGSKCEECHTVRGWQVAVQAVKNHNNRFPLVGAHAAVPCDECHKGAAVSQFQGLSTECISCHVQDFASSTNPNHQALNFPTDCTQCHNMDNWMTTKFDHLRFTGFALTGAHATLACDSCHVNGNYQLTSSACISCHLKDFNGTQNPNHVEANFPQDCSVCHNTVNWTSVTFNHNQFTSFPLTGAHLNVACDQCHVNGKFAGTPTDCASCHLKDFQGTTNPNHVQDNFSTTCQQCHNTNSWQNLTSFDHSTTGFPLTGAHTSLQCAQCHVNGNFNLTSANAACVSCHQTDFNNASNPNHAQAGFPNTCQQCHNTTTWTSATFDHSTTGFPLTGAHVSLQCSQCHINGDFTLTSSHTACVACHQTDFSKTTDPNHVQANFPTNCQQCHNTTSWTGATFDHSTTGFTLTGAHTTLQCAQCHLNGNYNLTSANTACVACHQTDFNNTTDPNHVQSGFPTTCQQCHTTASWGNASFDHSTTGFVLTGAHTTLLCDQCHVNGNYKLTSANTACVSCHQTDFNNTTDPNHVQSGFSTTCQQCHNTTSWGSATFDHSTTGFPLTGAHTTLQCQQCHVNGNFKLTTANTACVACHQTDFNNTNNPNHVQSGFPTTCQQCHNTTSWNNATFDHSTTGFPLTGAHTTLQCAQCHVNGNFKLTSANTACIACHQTDFNSTTNPNHVQSGFPTTCQQCHNTTSWNNATFDHSTTGFPLTGAHTTVQCALCHVNNNFNLTSANTACVSCHQTDYNKTTDPNHVQSGFPTTCQQCHNTTSWGSATFDHSTTGFPLTGAHTTLQCQQCHVSGNFKLTTANTACVSCHQTDYNNTNNPSHVQAGFPTTCQQCHNTTSWGSATFNHSTTGFALTGAHATLQCQQCHVNGNYNLTSANAACISCHQTDYNNTNNPGHVAAGFPTDCTLCHSTTSWTSATFNHATTGFALTGAHATLQCQQCHVNNNYKLTSANAACYSCHQADYNGTTNPNHASAGFPTDCSVCHSTTSWSGATFNHSNTPFPLTGAHTTVPCSSCHINNVFAGTPTDCYSCHKADYNGTTNPNHAAAGFPTTCATCHTTTAWTGATFNHTWFPIPHHSATQCTDCHTNSSNYAVFVCTNCHTQAQTDPEHTDVRGYVWNSANCYACHPKGQGG